MRNLLPSINYSGYSACVTPQWVTGFDSLNDLAGSRLISDMRFFCTRKPTYTRIMTGRSGRAYALAGFQITCLSILLRLVTPFDSVVTRLHKLDLGAFTMLITLSHPKSTRQPAMEVSHA